MENAKNDEMQKLENRKNAKFKIQCFLEENICFTLRDKIKHMEKWQKRLKEQIE